MEFMIATTVFTMVLLVCAFAIVHVGRMYFKGSIMSRTQDISRRLGEDVSQAIQFGARADDAAFRRPGNATTYTDGVQTVTANSLCLGSIRYTYVLGQSLGRSNVQSRHILWKDRVSISDTACTPVNMVLVTPTPGGVEFLGDNMRIARFDVPASTTGLYTVDLIVSHGDTADLFEPAAGINPDFSICKGVNAGGQFCASAIYKTTVGKRL